jgi:hypothetical protein
METFYIRVEHEIIEYTIIEVEAENAAQAMELAQSDDSYQSEVDWTLDDGIGENSFIALDDDYNPIEEN